MSASFGKFCKTHNFLSILFGKNLGYEKSCVNHGDGSLRCRDSELVDKYYRSCQKAQREDSRCVPLLYQLPLRLFFREISYLCVSKG